MSSKNHKLNSIWRIRALRLAGLWLLSQTWSTVASANMVGSDTQNFNPTTSGHDYVTVQSSQTFGGFGNFGLGLWANWATNTLPYFKGGDTEHNDKSKTLNDSLTSLDLVGGMGLTEDWDLGIALPYVIAQSIKSDDPHGQFGSKGNTEVRATTKFRLWQAGPTGFAVGGSVNVNRIKNNPYTGSSNTPTYNLEMIADTKLGPIGVAGNLGYRFRDQGDAVSDEDGEEPIQPFKNQTIGSVGASFRLPGTQTDLVGEVYGGKPNNDASDVSTRNPTAMELITGLRHYPTDDIALHGGIGTELVHSFSSPDFRLYAGITWISKIEKKASPPPAAESPPPAPAPPPAAIVKVGDFPPPDATIVLSDVLFNFNSSQLNHKTARRHLKTLMQAITTSKGLSKLIIEGHTCSIGTDAYNLSLSRRRSAAIKAWLVKEMGVSSAKILSIGLGESRPVASNKTESGRELNRRVEFKIYHANNPNFAQK